MSRLPIRVRLTLGFAVAMAVVLAAVGLFVYERVAGELLGTVDQTLVVQAGEEVGNGRVDSDTAGGTTLAQRFAADGQLTSSEPKGLALLVSRPDLARAHLMSGPLWLDVRLPHRPGP